MDYFINIYKKDVKKSLANMDLFTLRQQKYCRRVIHMRGGNMDEKVDKIITKYLDLDKVIAHLIRFFFN